MYKILSRIIIFAIIFLIPKISQGSDWQQVYKVIPNTVTCRYEWRYSGQIGVGKSTATVNAYMQAEGLIQGTTIQATDCFKYPDSTTKNSKYDVLVATASPAAVGQGAMYLDTDNNAVYVNTGTVVSPSWVDIMSKSAYFVVLTTYAAPGNAYGAATASVWSGFTYTVQSTKCDLFILAILDIYGYQTGATSQVYTMIYDGVGTTLSQYGSITHTLLSSSTGCTVTGFMTDLVKDNTVAINLKGSAAEANRARLDHVEMYVFEIPKL